MIRLLCVEGSDVGETFEFDKSSIVIGRAPDCDLCLDDYASSHHHAGIDLTPDGYVITELDATNELLVNDLRVKQAVLSRGNHIRVGQSLFVFLGGIEIEEGSEDPNHLIDIERAHRLMHIAYKASQAISTSLESADVYSLITDNVFENCQDVERVRILVQIGEGTEMEVVSSVSKGGGRDFEVSRSILERVRKDRVGILATDAMNDDRFRTAKSVARMSLRSLMCVPLLTRNEFLGAIYVENFTRPKCFMESDLELLTLLGNQASFALENSRLYDELQAGFYETVRSLSNALEAKDKYTRGHSDRVARLAVGIAEALGLTPDRIRDLRTAAELHDIGKIAIRERIIGKNGRLTAEEYEAIKKHPQLGVDILKPIRFLKPILPFILHHHERYNGRGYPDGLKGDAIPLEARILNLADAFDAMTSQRSYNIPKSFSEGLQQCQREAGRSFDASCVEAFTAYLAKHGDSVMKAAAEAPSETPKLQIVDIHDV